MLLVTGTMTIDYKGEKERARTFVQTFYLAPSQATEKSGASLGPRLARPVSCGRTALTPALCLLAASYYVLNDTFRILDAPKTASVVRVLKAGSGLLCVSLV